MSPQISGNNDFPRAKSSGDMVHAGQQTEMRVGSTSGEISEKLLTQRTKVLKKY